MKTLSFATLTTLLQPSHIGEALAQQHPDSYGMNFHSGRLKPGEIFVALAGAQHHGLQFAEQALAAGAPFIISDRPHPMGMVVADPEQAVLALGNYARAHMQGPVIAVTGSVGKTSTKTMLACALEAYSSPGNFNTPLALACTLLEHALAHPSAPLVLELGIDHVGEMAQLCALVRPDIGVLTSIAPSHLSSLGDIATVAREKAVLLAHSDVRIVSSQAADYIHPAQRAQATVYGLTPSATLTGTIVHSDPKGQWLEVKGIRFYVPYVGEAMASNALAALAVAQACGIKLKPAAERLAEVRLEPQRLHVHHYGACYLIDDSYNSNPVSMRAALDSLQHFPRPHWLIAGDMLELGSQSTHYHQQLGQWSRDLDAVIAVGTESQHMLRDNPQVQHAKDAEAAMQLLAQRSLPRRGTILVKGSRGIRLETVVEALQPRLASLAIQAPELPVCS